MSDRVPDYYGADPCACGYNKADPDGYCHWCRGAEMREEFECNKKCFDELGAQLALAGNQSQTLKQYMWKHQEQRYYWCKNCKCYHLTSQERREKCKRCDKGYLEYSEEAGEFMCTNYDCQWPVGR